MSYFHFIETLMEFIRNRFRRVSTATGRPRVRIPERKDIFFLRLADRFFGLPIHLFKTERLGRDIDHSHFAPTLRMSGAMPYLPHAPEWHKKLQNCLLCDFLCESVGFNIDVNIKLFPLQSSPVFKSFLESGHCYLSPTISANSLVKVITAAF